MSDIKDRALNLDDLDQVTGGMLGSLFETLEQNTTVLAADTVPAADGSSFTEAECEKCGKITVFRCGYSGGRGVCTVCGTPKDL